MTQHTRIIQDIEFTDGLDFEEILMTIEASLGIHFADNAFTDIQTLGQFHDLICQEAAFVPVTGTKCATAMSFYRLKAAINRTGAPRKLSPKTPLKALSDFDYAKIIRQLGNWKTSRPISISGFYLATGLTLAINIPLSFLIGGFSIVTGFLTFILCLALSKRFLPARLPIEKTVGELASSLAFLNLRLLAVEGAALTPRILWKLLVRLVADKVDIAPDQLSRESRFI